jgi:hypothetical protein
MFGAWLSLVERLVRDQEAGGSNPLAPTISFNNLPAAGAKTAHPVARVAWWFEGAYTALMAENATTPSASGQPLQNSTDPLGQPLDFDVRGLGRRLPRTDAPEGWLRKIERREGKVWVGFFHLWATDANSRRVRTKKEKTLGPASMPKHKAQQKLAEYIEEYTGRVTRQGSSIDTFTDLWKAFLCGKVWAVVQKDEGGSAIPFRKTRPSDHREPIPA